MNPRQRQVTILIVIFLIMAFFPAVIYGQDGGTVRAVGSGLAAPVFEQLAQASNVSVEFNVTGTTAGISSFCAGEASVTLATRPLTQDEEAACSANQVQFVELFLGSNILTLIGNPADAVPQCLTTDMLNTVFAPSSTIDNWALFAGGDSNIPLTVFLPTATTVAYSLLDNLVDGVGLRDLNITTLDSNDSIIDSVAATPGALGVVSLTPQQNPAVRYFDIDTNISGCHPASAESVENRLYPASNRLLAYINVAQFEAVRPIFEPAFSAGGIQAITVADFVPPSDTTLQQNVEVIAGTITGRQFSREVTAFAIPDVVAGEIRVSGTTEAREYLTALTTAFSTQYPGTVVTPTLTGLAAGIAPFCNGEADILTAFKPLTEEEIALCAQQNVTPQSFFVGSQVAVLLTANTTDYPVCLTLDEVAKVWGATAEGVTENWNAVRSDFPDQAITLFTPTDGSLLRDLLVMNSATTIAPRTSTEESADPAYRAAAVANLVGAQTFMTWGEYLSLPATESARVRVVEIDGGQGCVAPSSAAFADGTYALARPLYFIVNRASIARQDVQSLLWFMSSDENYTLRTDARLLGVSFTDLASIREQLQALYTEVVAEVSASFLTPEVTPEATSEASAETTDEPAIEATAEATSEATAEATDETAAGG